MVEIQWKSPDLPVNLADNDPVARAYAWCFEHLVLQNLAPCQIHHRPAVNKIKWGAISEKSLHCTCVSIWVVILKQKKKRGLLWDCEDNNIMKLMIRINGLTIVYIIWIMMIRWGCSGKWHWQWQFSIVNIWSWCYMLF